MQMNEQFWALFASEYTTAIDIKTHMTLLDILNFFVRLTSLQLNATPTALNTDITAEITKCFKD